MLTDYHMHLENGPYSLDWIAEFLKTADMRGIDELGFSEHGYKFKETSHFYYNDWFQERQTASIYDYMNLLTEAKSHWPQIKKSIEMDYFPEIESEIGTFIQQHDFDYVIGSIHWLDDWSFDVTEMKYLWDTKDIEHVYLQYFDRVAKMAESGLFDIIGHFDVIKVFGHKPEQFTNKIVNKIEEAIEKISYNNLCIEISTAGLRKPVREIYPNKAWLKLIYEANIPITLASDAHYPKHVGQDYPVLLTFLNDIGYEHIAIFDNRTYRRVPID